MVARKPTPTERRSTRPKQQFTGPPIEIARFLLASALVGTTPTTITAYLKDLGCELPEARAAALAQQEIKQGIWTSGQHDVPWETAITTALDVLNTVTPAKKQTHRVIARTSKRHL